MMKKPIEDKVSFCLNDSLLEKQLNMIFEHTQDIYKNKKSPFLVECLRRGAESMETEFIKMIDMHGFPQLVEAIQECRSVMNKIAFHNSLAHGDLIRATTMNKMFTKRNYDMLCEMQGRDSTVMDDVLGGLHYDIPPEVEDALEDFLNQIPWYKHGNTKC